MVREIVVKWERMVKLWKIEKKSSGKIITPLSPVVSWPIFVTPNEGKRVGATADKKKQPFTIEPKL